MTKIVTVVGKVGSGKTRVLLKKMSEMKEVSGILFVDVENYQLEGVKICNEIYSVKDEKQLELFLKDFKSKIESGEIALVIDNLKLASNLIGLDKVKELLKLPFKEKIVSAQLNRKASDLIDIATEELKKVMETHFEIEQDSIVIEKAYLPEKYPF